MTKSYNILTILLVLLFVSCRNEPDETLISTNNEKYNFLLNTQVEPSRYWSTGDIIGITAYVSGGEELYMNRVNRQYKSVGSGFFVPVLEDDKIFCPLAGNSVDFIAYYPYQADATTTCVISLSEQSDHKQLDLLYSNNAKNKTNVSGNIGFTFNRVLSKIVIKTTPSGGLENKDLYDMNIKINNISNEGTLYFADGSIKHSAQKSSIKMKTETNGKSSEAIILPGSASGVGFTIELANGYVYSTDFKQEQEFISGHIHTYNVTITQTGVNFSPVGIENWVITDTIPQEKIADEIVYKSGDFYPNPNNPKTAIGVVYWLKPGTGGKEGKIVSADSEFNNWGDSNNINLKTVISTGTMNWEIIIQTDPTLENFPAFKWCKDKGDGWYLPSRYELHVLNEIWTANQEYMNSNIELINGEPFSFNDVYLASSESRSWPDDNAELYYFSDKGWGPILKSEAGRVRAIKEF